MTSTSFVQNLLPPNNTATSTVTLRNGQMIYGKVQHIYSSQMAEISIGQIKLMAQLDAPIVSGERYLFQVQNGEGTTILNVLPHDSPAQSLKDMAQLLLKHFSLSQSKEALTLATFFVKNNIPVNKEMMSQTVQWAIESNNMKETVQVLKVMNDLSLPMTKVAYKAIEAVGNKTSLQSLFSNLLKGIDRGASETELAMKALLTHFSSTNAEKMAHQSLQKAVSTWLAGEKADQMEMFRFLQDVGFVSKQASSGETIEKSLQMLQVNQTMAKNQQVKEIIQLLQQISQGQKPNGAFVQLLKAVKDNMKNIQPQSAEATLWKQIQSELQRSGENIGEALRSMPGNQQLMEKISKHLFTYVGLKHNDVVASHSFLQMLSSASGQKNGLQQGKAHLANMLVRYGEGQSSVGEEQIIRRFFQEEAAALSMAKTSPLATEIKNTLRLFGSGFENYLANMDKVGIINEAELLTLKPLLMKLLYESSSSFTKENAEQLVHKIMGQQLLSQSSGPIQNIFVQLPVSFPLSSSEVTIRWSGRKKEDGSIDPSYCRVLFYLQLENIDEIVIDMVVQNAVLKICIINKQANDLKEIASPHFAQFKDKLKEIGYQLSAVTFEEPKMNTSFKRSNHSQNSKILGAAAYNGVDIKI
ncbi:MAG: hypothetical protein ACI35P_06040 [Bacillus sp. (in: firmicutes)]